MKKSGFLVVLALTLCCFPAYATPKQVEFPHYPDRAEIVAGSSSRMNFNLSERPRTGTAGLLQKKNEEGPKAGKFLSSPVNVGTPICVGSDCGCSSGRMKR